MLPLLCEFVPGKPDLKLNFLEAKMLTMALLHHRSAPPPHQQSSQQPGSQGLAPPPLAGTSEHTPPLRCAQR